MPKNTISTDDKRWRAEEDARTVKRYAEICNDKSRMMEVKKMMKSEAMMTNKAMSMMEGKQSARPKQPSKKNTDNIRNAMMSGMSKGKK
jgi:hypothetical protein